MREHFLPFALPAIEDDEVEAVVKVIRSGWLTTGPITKQFEKDFAAAVGAKHAVAVNSCTAALHLALDAIGVGPGDEVIVPTMTFTATAAVVHHLGATPVLVDVDPRTLNIDPAVAERAITDRTRAIMPVHIAGLPVDLDAIDTLAARHDLTVVEDAAHAFPVQYRGRTIGSTLAGERHRFVCFSFYATKTITTAEGGMLVTDDDTWAEHCNIMSLHGISRDAWNRYSSSGSWYYEVVAPGYKYNLTDIGSALGQVQLAKAKRLRDRRAEIAAIYTNAFRDGDVYDTPDDAPAGLTHAWHLYVLRLNLDRLTIDRAQFIEELRARNIGSSVHFIPLHYHPFYRDTFGYQPDDLPVAMREYWRLVSLPIYPTMSDEDVQDVVDAVRNIAVTYRS